MPSIDHEFIIQLITTRPSLLGEVVPLLKQWLPPGERYTDVRAEFADLDPATIRADAVLRVGEPARLALVIEIQLRRDDNKLRVWPGYAAMVWRKLGVPVDVVVLTIDGGVATWAATPVQTSPRGTWAPIVIGPAQLPVTVAPEVLRQAPELGVLATLAHPDEPAILPTAEATIWALASLPGHEKALYLDMIWARLAAPIRSALEAQMNLYDHKWQSELFRNPYDEGRQEGRLETLLETVRPFVTPAELARLQQITSVAALQAEVDATLKRLLTRA